MSGCFLISRSIFDSKIWASPPETFKLFIYLLGKARWKKDPKKYPGFEINRGEVLTSLGIISDENKCETRGHKPWPRETVRRHLKSLEEMGMITIMCDTYGTHIKIINYDTYQDLSTYQCDTDVMMVRRSWDDRETEVGTIGSKIIKDKKDKKGKKDTLPSVVVEKLEIAPLLFMKKDQAHGLVEAFGREACEYYKNVVSDYLVSSGKKYKDYAAFMRNWIRREQAERRGFYAKDRQAGYQPHTAANTAQKNLEFITKLREKEKHEEENGSRLPDDVIDGEKEFGTKRADITNLVSGLVRSIR